MSLKYLAVALLAGGLVGGALGRQRFASLDDHRPLCISCHHSTAKISEFRVELAPHSTDFDAPCHACHVLPVKQYLQYSFVSWGLSTPDWVNVLENPTIDGQTCKECHLSRGRGVLPCEKCHRDLESEVRPDKACSVCHNFMPLHPHNRQDCRDCHVETFLSPHNVAERTMTQKMHFALPPPPEPHKGSSHAGPVHVERDQSGYH